MLTLREFLEEINANEHYRIYQPNRDCLIFESYLKVHSPYYFDDEEHDTSAFNKDYYENNEYSDTARRFTKMYDEETKAFLKRFGDHAVFRIECSSFIPHNVFKDEQGLIKVVYVTDETQPDLDYISCFNIFID